MNDSSDREIIVSRVVSAPRSTVWRAWTEERHLKEWWGPNGFTLTTKRFEMREGGSWDFIMHGPDGREYPNKIVFTEIVEPERIAHDHGGDDGKVQFKAVITFEDLGDKTKVTMRSQFPSAAERERVVKEYGALEGANQTIDKMAAYAAAM